MTAPKDRIYEFIANIRNRHVSRCGACTAASTMIFVFRHFRCTLPSVFDDRKVYYPLWCGPSCRCAAPGELCDNAGQNISKYNPYLNEMTGIFWVASHYKELGDPEYVGFNHYRRHLEWTPSLTAKGTIIATSVTILQKIGYWLRLTIPSPHLQPTLDALADTLAANGCHDFRQYLASHRVYARNMFITDRETFFRYFSFIKRYISLFMSEVDRSEETLSFAPPAQKRLYGYLLEQLTSYWIWREKRTKQSTVITTYVQDFTVENNGKN